MNSTTHFMQDSEALEGRSDSKKLDMTRTMIESVNHLQCIIDAMPLAILILNNHRQIVAANTEVLDLVGLDIEQVLGKRPGELVGCLHANDGPDGCGTGMSCRVCGAVNALLKCLSKVERQTEECRITLSDGQALDWKVTATPLFIQGESLLLTAIQDIGDQNRRNALERIFFHDIINTIGAIVGFTQLMADEMEDTPELTEVIQLANELLEEVQSQRDLALAERGDLELKTEVVHLESFLNRLGQLYQSHPVAENRNLVIHIPENLSIETDPHLLKRILGNMIKNSFEASSDGQSIQVFCVKDNDVITFGVRNSSVMSKEVQLQIFNRSFSTKSGIGRGLGTYSMKLLGEKYLGGKISCISNPVTGTIFSLDLPV